MPVYAKQYGRLGNQLFQKAAAIGYAMKHDMAFDLRQSAHPTCYYRHVIHEAGHHYQELPFDQDFLNGYAIVLNGYWQSEKYFAHCPEIVLKWLGNRWITRAGGCSIHVRRGDYIKYPDKHPVVTMEYLTQAMEMMAAQRGITRFVVFSDDLQWCITQFASLPYEFIYSTDKSEQEDLELMSGCEHNIISNSTFSWWGAWLNQNPDKVVISPSKNNWFGPGNSHLCTDDIIPDNWIQIKY